METETRFIVRYAETDQMGIVHHSNYPVWFEAGRTDFFMKIGKTISQMEEVGIFLPLTNMECSFKKPARYEDRIVVKTKIKNITCVRIEFIYEVVNNMYEVFAVGSTFHAWTDKALKPLNIEKKLPELCRILKETLE